MEANGVLFAVNHPAGNTQIAWVENASDRFKVGTELFAPEEGSLRLAPDAAVLMLTLLMNEKPMSTVEAHTRMAFQPRRGCAACRALLGRSAINQSTQRSVSVQMSTMLQFPPLTRRVFTASRLSLDFPQVCQGHVKDAFTTTIANRTKAKQSGRRVLGEGLGPLHLTLTPAANNRGVEPSEKLTDPKLPHLGPLAL